MKKIIIGIAVVVVVGIMFVFYQQPFGGGSTHHHASSKTTHSSNNPQKPKSNLTAAYQNAVAHAKTAQPLSMAEVKRDGIVPKTLIIPSLKIEANVDQVGLLKSGQIGVPNGTQNVAWYKDGPKPGQKGNAIIDGHVDSYKGPAVFFNLKNLKKNDKIYVVGKNGKKLTFKVIKIKSYPTNHAPLQTVFGYTDQPMLNLITCTGTYQKSKGTHDHRLVVYTKLVE